MLGPCKLPVRQCFHEQVIFQNASQPSIRRKQARRLVTSPQAVAVTQVPTSLTTSRYVARSCMPLATCCAPAMLDPRSRTAVHGAFCVQSMGGSLRAVADGEGSMQSAAEVYTRGGPRTSPQHPCSFFADCGNTLLLADNEFSGDRRVVVWGKKE